MSTSAGVRDQYGRFVSETKPAAPPPVRGAHGRFIPKQLQSTHPQPSTPQNVAPKSKTPAKDIRFRVHPAAAFCLALILCLSGLGIGRLTSPTPVTNVEFIPLTSTPAAAQVRDAAFTGTLHYDTGTKHYFLVGTDAKVTEIAYRDTASLTKFVGKKIVAAGSYDTHTNTLRVDSASAIKLLTSPVTTPASPQPPASLEPQL